MIDPGPDVPEHVGALASAVAGAERVSIVLTHGHSDHAAGAASLRAATGAEVVGPVGVQGVDREVPHGGRVETDQGALVAVDTPGHARHHLCFHWPERDAVFAGDMLLGRGDTTWVAEYPGCVADYLESLERLRSLDARVIYPTHGPRLDDAAAAIDRYEAHRRSRIHQAREAMEAHPGADIDELLLAVYGRALPEQMRSAARGSLEALVEYVRARPD